MSLRLFETTRLVAILRTRRPRDLAPAVAALLRGGIACQEIALTTPGALTQIAELRQRFGPELCLGAGSVLEPKDAEAAFAAGAEFIVTPTLQPDTIAFCRERGAAIFCGAYTPTEALAAHRAGATYVKLFPAETWGPSGLAAIRAPLPFLRVVPTGGVSERNATAFLAAGAAGLAVGGQLCGEAAIEAADYAAIEQSARRLTDLVAAAPRENFDR